MELPAITLPKIELPFDIPIVLFPMVDHFMVVLPVIILVLELMNVVLKKKTVSVISFLFLLIAILVVSMDHFIDVTYMNEAVATLSETGRVAFSEHKILGVYLVIMVVIVFVFKLLSMILGKKMIKALYLLLLIIFVVGILQQNREGDKLIYEHGFNVNKVKAVNHEILKMQKVLEASEEEIKKAKLENHALVIKLEEVQKQVTIQAKQAEELKESITTVVLPTAVEKPVEATVTEVPTTIQNEIEVISNETLPVRIPTH